MSIQKNNTQTHHFAITGMTCQACASRLEKVLNKKPNIHQASVNFATETLVVVHDESLNEEQIMGLVDKVGFGARPSLDSLEMQGQKHPWDLILLWLLSLPFWVGMLGMLVGSHQLMLPVAWQFILSSLVQVVFGVRFYQSAWASLKGGLANMDVLVALGTTAIWIYSSYLFFTLPSHQAEHAVYFEASVMVIAFVRLGKYLEQGTKKQSLNSLSLLTKLIPDRVLKIQGTQGEKIALDQVKLGDVLRASAGDRIAVDGLVMTGSAMCDEAHLTGESRLLTKEVGSWVYAGSQVVDGSVDYQAKALGMNTQLGDMMQALAQAQGSKADIARFADKVAAIFVPVVVCLSLMTGLGNFLAGQGFDVALMRAVAVLVIACPCALGLATPVAIMAGMGVAARHGIWFKDAVSLELAGKIDSIVFDKTGTLTTGRPDVVDFQVLAPGLDELQILGQVASLEQHTNHPLAAALVTYAQQKGVLGYTLHQVEHQMGLGLSARLEDGSRLSVGSPSFTNMEQMLPQLLSKTCLQQNSLVGVAIDDQPIALFTLSDKLKDDSLPAIQKMQDQGSQVIIMSGDSQSVVDKVASTLGIKTALGQMKPRDKLAGIQKMIERGRVVAMVGDGVNDAPAMACAQVSFAVPLATDAAKRTASVRLLGESLMQVYYAQVIAKKTLNAIKQNLFFALVYNCIGIVLAALGLLSPMLAALAMTLSSLSVLANALRLKGLTLDVNKNHLVGFK